MMLFEMENNVDQLTTPVKNEGNVPFNKVINYVFAVCSINLTNEASHFIFQFQLFNLAYRSIQENLIKKTRSEINIRSSASKIFGKLLCEWSNHTGQYYLTGAKKTSAVYSGTS